MSVLYNAKQALRSKVSLLIIDYVIALLSLPSAVVFSWYRRIGVSSLPRTTGLLRNRGVFPITKHYYEPLFDGSELKSSLSMPRNLPGVDFNEAGQLAFIRSLNFAVELIDMELDKPGSVFPIKNERFGSGDAEFLYQFLRKVRPQKIVEIGSGYSSLMIAIASQKNFDGSGRSYEHVIIDPYPDSSLCELSRKQIIRCRCEDVEVQWDEYLNPGDLLFIDSTHIIRPQGDVLKEYLEILPSLKPGVYVQIHDIFSPRDYLDHWINNDIRMWNEQYILEALLSNSSRYQVVSALNQLKNDHFELLRSVCPYLTSSRDPGSFYIEIQE